MMSLTLISSNIMEKKNVKIITIIIMIIIITKIQKIAYKIMNVNQRGRIKKQGIGLICHIERVYR